MAMTGLSALLQAAPDQALKFEEVLGLVRTNLSEISEADLSRAAALGLIQQLGSKVQLAATNANAEAAGSNATVRASVMNQEFGYFRLERVGGELASELQKKWQLLVSSNRLKGAILDLRYAKGTDYKAAAETADLFVQTERVLIRAGEVEHRSTKGGAKIAKPLAVLLNGHTSGAPEALAAALREAGAALLIGSSTAGEARLFQAFELSTGQTLRIGTVPVMVGDKPIPGTGVAPDIAVQVNRSDERAYYEDPYVDLARFSDGRGANEPAQTGSGRTRRFNEAELVRRHRDGLDLTTSDEGAAPSAAGKMIADPTLARAVDFLKGVSALRLTSPD